MRGFTWRSIRWLLIALLLLEFTLRTIDVSKAYVHYGTIRRPCQCREMVFEGPTAEMDPRIRHCTNRLGLRGRMPGGEETRILAIGNSTTECTYLDDARAWPVLVDSLLRAAGHSAWVGNAGVNGVTTRGNLIVLEELVPAIQPELVIFLPGANDRDPLRSEQDTGLFTPASLNAAQWAAEHNRMAASLLRLYRSTVPLHIQWSVDTAHSPLLPIPAARLEAYRQRLIRFVGICRDRNIKLLLLTQPLAASTNIVDHTPMEQLNEVVRQLAFTMDIALVDLAGVLPNDRSLYLDGLHFSNKGAAEVALMIAPAVNEMLGRSW